jgi:type VI secretion system protein ImpL
MTYAAQVLDPTTMTDIEETRILVQKSFGSMDPSVRRSLFEAPLRAAWGQVVAAVQAHLNRRWEGEVCRTYRTGLEDRYPMRPESRTDASLPAFDRFFHPSDGVLASFRSEVLASFIDPDTHLPHRWEGIGIRLAAETQEALRRADRIGRTLFSEGGLGLSFALQADHPERADGAPAASQTYVKIHGREARYDMGSYRPWTSFEWPDRPGAIVRVRTRDGEAEPIRIEGDWAWWRLLERATIQRRTPTMYRVRWPLENGLVLRYMLRLPENASLHPDPGKDLFRFRCPSILG